MAALTWDASGSRFFEMGVDRGVLYPTNDSGAYQKGVAWNGLTGVTDSADGGDANDMWADNMNYASVRSREKATGTITAYTYPDEFGACDGVGTLAKGITIGQQGRNAFGFSYRTQIGNDVSDDIGYKIHIVYGATASPSSKDYSTINDSPDAIEFSWDYECVPVSVTGHQPTAHLVIDSRNVSSTDLKKIEDALYGSGSVEPKILMPNEVAALITAA